LDHDVLVLSLGKFRISHRKPMKNVPALRFQKVEIEPFTREEVSRMLKAYTHSREADTTYRRQFVMRRPTANHDQAMILTLLDSCVRASEFCSFRAGGFARACDGQCAAGAL
jgi:integrase